MGYQLTLKGNGGRYGWSGGSDSATSYIYVGTQAHSYSSSLGITPYHADRHIHVKSAKLTIYARSLYSGSKKCGITLQIGTSSAYNGTGPEVGRGRIGAVRAAADIVFSDDGCRELEQYFESGAQFYLYLKQNSDYDDYGFTAYGYSPGSSYAAYVPVLTVEYSYSTVSFGVDGEWVTCEAYFGVGGVWKQTEIAFGSGGEWKEC